MLTNPRIDLSKAIPNWSIAVVCFRSTPCHGCCRRFRPLQQGDKRYRTLRLMLRSARQTLTHISEPPPSLLAVIIDTNPHAWALLQDSLSLPQALANLLVFISAHLAFNHANKVAVIASHAGCAEFLFPVTSSEGLNSATSGLSEGLERRGADIHHALDRVEFDDANFYRPFSQVSTALRASLMLLMKNTSPSTLAKTPTTSLAGAITLALSYINKAATLLTSGASPVASASTATTSPLSSRILVLSVSTASPNEYIPLMNTIFASQRLSIPIDIFSLASSSSSSSFLQQACDATSGIYLSLKHPHGMLQTLFQAFLPSQPSRAMLISPTQISVDFRAACFCHRNVVDIGFVCSICLSIFCEPPEGAVCLTCGTQLKLEDYGKAPVLVAKRKKKRRREAVEGSDPPQ